jgi:hypothetical protein
MGGTRMLFSLFKIHQQSFEYFCAERSKDLDTFKESYLRPTLGGNFLAMFPVINPPLFKIFNFQITFFIR